VFVSEGNAVVPVPAEDVNEAPTVPGRDASLVRSSSFETNETGDEQARNPSFHPGARIADKYVVERLIGEGGLGVVVAAKHIHLDQSVAIKYLRPKALATKAVAERFLRGARLAAKIRSEHIVHVYDVGTLPDGAPYMVMEYLAGTDLGRLLNASGPLPVDRAVDYVLQACEALAEAHVAGIVHRDIKPDNLFISTSPGGTAVLKVLDFGISKMSTKRTTSGGVGELTEAGDKFGTPVYMSPEQLLASGNVDARTDVWAIGVVLYELLTGALPFDGDSLPELCTAILHRPPTPLLQVRPYLPLQLQIVLEQCLSKDVENRFQNVAELAQELRPFAGPVGCQRIDQIVRVILGGGDKVRASVPSPRVSSASALAEALTLIGPADRSVATTGSGLGSWGRTSAFHKGPGGRKRVLLAAGAGVATVALIVVALSGGRSRPESGAAHAAPPAVTAVSADVAPQPANPETASVVPSEHLPPPAAEAAPATASTAAPLPVRGGPRRAPKGAASSAAKDADRPPHADPNAVINPFE
jgi:eukaryotic-like serine/threonine-protein kinase